ncbi:hypothetical protein MBLNU459_g8388t1 [Dothideomycetes sp. NU459]
MAPSGAQTRAQDRIAAVRFGAEKRNVASTRKHGAPDVYEEMLSEATSSPAPEIDGERPIKRRRVAGVRKKEQTRTETGSGTASSSRATGVYAPLGSNAAFSDGDDEAPPKQQFIEDSEESDDDIDWEQVGFDHVDSRPTAKQDLDDDIGDITIDVSQQKIPKRSIAKRKPATTADKLLRLAVHEAHVLFLLFHVHIRNAWCNSGGVQSKLRPLLTPKIISFLNPDTRMIQFGRSESFLSGLKLAVDLWRARFKITESGMRRSNWVESPQEIQQQINVIQDEISPVVKEDFIRAAKALTGSQDPLPFTTFGVKSTTPQRGKSTIYLDNESDRNGVTSAEEGSATGSASEGSTPRVMVPGRRRRIGQPKFAASGGSSRPAPPPAKKKASIRKLDYPIFWVEAFNSAYQKWVPVDASVTGTVGKANKIEPPASYDQCSMTYVMAFEETGIARDVTRRYTKAYNAKTRKQRIESTETGERWWRNARKVFRRRRALDRDQVEDAELSKKEAAEGLPTNVQDFKDHPYYALERHLKRHEVIWPKREVGKINAGKSSSSSVESVYRRHDVQIVRSADKWYRFGREIKPGEQALKHVSARSQRSRRADMDTMDTKDEDSATSALYAFSQTSLYVPPPVVQGKIPRNIYGNLDVYVPSMIPPGGSHVRHKHASKAARLIGVDYADAVTGFQFKGRHGTAVIEGIIVAAEYREAVQAVLEGFEYEQETRQAELRTAECLRLWRRFLTGLRIGERLGLHKRGVGDSLKSEVLKTQMDEAEDEQDNAMEAGGFFPDPDQTTAAPTAGRFDHPISTKGRQEDTLFQEEHEDIQEEAPRVRRQRKITIESDLDDSGDEYVPEAASTTSKRGNRTLATHHSSHKNVDDLPKRSLLSRASRDGQLPGHEGYANDYEAAGGFLPGDVEDATTHLGGGFLPESDDGQAEEPGGGFDIELYNEAEHFGGGFVSDEENNEPDVVEDDSVISQKEDIEGDAVEDIVGDEEAILSGGGFVPDEKETQLSPKGGTGSGNTPIVRGGFQENLGDNQGAFEGDALPEKSDDEKGSLLSHDPDDEDAEPEWLNNTNSLSSNPMVGVSGIISLNDSATLSVAILGSIRTIRDFVEGPSILVPEIQDAIEISSGSDGSITLSRVWLDNVTSTSLKFTPQGGMTSISGDTIGSIKFLSGLYNFTAAFDYPQLKQLGSGQVLNPESQQLITQQPDQTKSLSFLSYTDKLLAGAWRFLTYFGRDSMISLLLLQPVLSEDKGGAIEAVISAVLERLNSTDGSVCHEETLGDYATYLNQQRNISSTEPVYDYKMIDSDYYLPLVMKNYFIDSMTGQNRLSEFFDTVASINPANAGLSYAQLALINAEKIMSTSAAFAAPGGQIADHLIHLKENQIVGEWRDSTYGIGGGRIPYDVNTALVPAALRSIAALSAGGLFPSHPEWATLAASYAQVWEDSTLSFFSISFSPNEAKSLVQSYVNNSGYAIPSLTSSITDPITFHGLALDGNDNQTLVRVMNTDDCFRLYLLNSTSDQTQLSAFLNQTAAHILSPFPIGLSTPVGLLVSNPAYGGDDVYAQNWTNAAYHGTVVWSWPLAMMAKGLERQLGRCNTTNNSSTPLTTQIPDFCTQTDVYTNVRAAYNHLWDLIEANADHLSNEVWSWIYEDGDFVFEPLGALPPPPGTSPTESDIRQLWSLTFLAVTRDPGLK